MALMNRFGVGRACMRIVAMLVSFQILFGTATFGQTKPHTITPVVPETLSNTFIRCFHKDSKGYLWIGTADGLIRYDGTNAHRYQHDSQRRYSLSHNNINAIIEDQDGLLWIGTSQGVAIYHPNQDNFNTLDSLPGLKNQMNNRYVTALAFDKSNNLWIGTHGGGINVFNPAKREFSYIHKDPNQKNIAGKDYVNALLLVGDFMWSGSKGGLQRYHTGDMRPAPLTFIDDQLPPAQITALVPDNLGNVWMTSVNGEVLKITSRNGYFTIDRVIAAQSLHGVSWNTTLTFCRDAAGNFWMGGENSGLNYVDSRARTITKPRLQNRDAASLPTTSIRTIYVDDTGLIWVGTFNKGAYLISEKQRNAFSEGAASDNLAEKHVKSFAEDKDGNVWIVAHEVGLCKVNVERNMFSRVAPVNARLKNKFLNAVIADRRGNLWIGSMGDGISKIDPGTWRIKNYPVRAGSFGDDKILCLYEDKRGKVWAGTQGSGLFYYDEASDAFRNLNDANQSTHVTPTAYITTMLEDSNGTLWVGTAYGLFALDRNNAAGYTYRLYLPRGTKQSLGSPGIQSLYEDGSKNLWIGTTDNGMCVKHEGDTTFQTFNRNDGLRSNTVRGIVSDAAGNIWVSGDQGLSKFNVATNTFTNFTREDGLRSENFYSNACLRTTTGKVFFGSNDGYNAFNPDSVQLESGSPRVDLVDLKINNQSVLIGTPGSPLKEHIRDAKEISLTYDQRSFVLDFAAVDISQGFKRRYCYKLEGFDKQWNCTDGVATATYTNMDPGEYVFLVKADDGKGGWSDSVTRLDIVVQPLVWKTWWAISIYILLLAAFVVFVTMLRRERAKMAQRLAFEQMAREREHEVSESKTQFFTNISHELRTPLSLILVPLENLLQVDELPVFVRNKITSAHRSTTKLMHLVNELMDFSKIENGGLQLNVQPGDLIEKIREIAATFDDIADKRNIGFSVASAAASLQGWFDHDKLDKIVVNVLSNAFKFTRDGGTISVHVNLVTKTIGEDQNRMLARCVQIEVLDNGFGISASELPHIFDKFYQAKSATRVANPGTGIGLAWTKALVELHRGTVEAESILDKETKFIITIPIEAAVYAAADHAQLPSGFQRVLSQSGVEVTSENEALQMKSDTKYEVLVVEDNDELRAHLVEELQSHFTVLQARDGAEGWAVALGNPPDAIISDILMPNQTGIELCKSIKSDLKTSHIPFILLTAKASLDDQITGVQTGADIYLTKPFSIRLLISHLNNLIDSRRKLYTLFSQDVYFLPGRNTADDLDKVFLQRLVDYIGSNLQNDQLGVDTVAESFNMSRIQVYRKIKALTGKTAVEFIRHVRLKQALRLMEAKKYTLSEIAFHTGFSSASYFTKCFREEYGKAPSEFLAAS